MSDYAKQMEGAIATAVTPPSYTIATLPANPLPGSIAVITNQLTTPCAKGAAPAAGGTVRCLVFYNGAGWVGA